MAKQILKIDQFHGGLNNNSDPRDIMDNELSEATDVMVDELGTIRMMGGLENHVALTSTPNVAGLAPGRGLFYFSHDRLAGELGESDSSTRVGEPIDGDDYLILCDSGGVGHDIYSKTENTWGTVVGDMTLPTYVVVDGAVRISDADFDRRSDLGSINRWYGYIQRFNFPGTVLGHLYEGSLTATPQLYGHLFNQWWNEPASLVVPGASSIVVDTAMTNTDLATETISLQVGKQPLGSSVISACDTSDGWGVDHDGTADPGESLSIQVNEAINIEGTGCIALTGNTTYTANGSTPISLNFILADGSPAASAFDFTDRSIYFSLYFQGSAFKDQIDYLEVRVRSAADEYASYRVETDGLNSGIATDSWNQTIELAESKHDSIRVDFDKTNIISIDFMFHLVAGEVLNFGSATPGIPELAVDNIYHGVQGLSTTIGDWGGEYRFYYSFIYDEKQESLLTEFAGDDFESNNMMSAYFTVFYHKITTGIPKPRRTGVNIYTSRTTTDAVGVEDDKYLVLECDFVKGVRVAGGSAHAPWVGDDTLTSYTAKSAELTSNIKGFETYESINGYPSSDPSNTHVKGGGFKTAVVANRMLYTANVCFGTQTDKRVAGDGMFKSPVDRFDVVIPDRLVEVAVNDGDEIIKLETYADRLLQFKKRKMYLINISQELEFLEDTFNHKGVLHHGATCLTDYGIAWVNRLGCYLYDGKSVNNLLEKQGRQIIKESIWESFTTDNSIIGYLPKKRQLIVLKDCTATSDGDIYLFDMVTRSWVQGNSKFTDDVIQSNFINDWNGDLVHAHTNDTGNISKWSDVAIGDAENISIKTKDYDFGQPGQFKKVYGVRISYKGNGSVVTTKYSKNGDTNTLYSFEGQLDGVPTGSVDSTPFEDKSSDLTVWHEAFLKPATMSSANNIFSFQLHLGGIAGSTFAINDISILYRLKTVK